MYKLAPLSTCHYKLIHDGEIIGILAIPEEMANALKENSFIQFSYNGFNLTKADSTDPGYASTKTPFKSATIYAIIYPYGQNSIQLEGITVTEIEKLDGFGFYPGTVWIRQQLEQVDG